MNDFSDAIDLEIAGIVGLLGEEDDPGFWTSALTFILGEFATLAAPAIHGEIRAEVGRCSHWLRPHQTRWTADGGFAWPDGYGFGGWQSRSWPQFDWSVILKWERGRWEPAPGRSIKPLLRVALPSRTRRHPQAAIHTVWMHENENCIIRYGFRCQQDAWRCTAAENPDIRFMAKQHE